jgi:hypothetical protein
MPTFRTRIIGTSISAFTRHTFATSLRRSHRQRSLLPVQFAVTTISLAEILTGPPQTGDEALAERYRAVLETWHVVD